MYLRLRHYLLTWRTFFVLSLIMGVSCSPKNNQPVEDKNREASVPKVIPVEKVVPVDSEQALPPLIITPPTTIAPTNVPPKVIPLSPKEVEKKDVSLNREDSFTKRPPQFVMFAFDNCTENERWQDLSQFSSEMRELNKDIEFTFFLSGVNFIPDKKRMLYKGPHRNQGASNIGFGGTLEDIKTRSTYAYKLYAEGHELASHAVGHFSGIEWSQDDWVEELQKFKNIIVDNFEFFGFSEVSKMASSIVGFRAPYLDRSAGLYPALKSLGYRYDTSYAADYRLWPKKNAYGLWQFPLFELTIVGNGSKSISMDYNFFVRQSKDKNNPQNDPENEDKFADEMMQTYLKYFKLNYFGNRAPLSIGHHFFPYQRGVYNRVLKQFARKICDLPEVKCVKYSRLADYLDSLSTKIKDDFQAGRFERLPEYRLP
jgi:hypothetical protein